MTEKLRRNEPVVDQGKADQGKINRPLPGLGFLGVGWIGRNRLEVIARHQAGEVLFIADPIAANSEQALQVVPGAQVVHSLQQMLTQAVTGVVIATPSALHAEQAIVALEAGKAVFCQKPLGRNRAETQRVVAAARAAGRLLGVDLSYRYTEAMQAVFQVIQSGGLGEIYGVELTFHNGYGPDKAWFYDPKRSGGGCVIDLGVHLVDLALWCLGFPEVHSVNSSLFCKGKRITASDGKVEDYATAGIRLKTGTQVSLTCSWQLPVGQEASISAAFYGTQGGVAFRNIQGSFYDFVAERFSGTHTETISLPPDDWPGRAGVVWANRLAAGETFDPAAEEFVKVADVLDQIYGR